MSDEQTQAIEVPASGDSDCSDFRCPHCEKPIQIDLVAQIPEDQTLTVSLQTDAGDLFAAEVVAELIANTAKAITETARCVGTKVAVMVKDVQVSKRSVVVVFATAIVR